MALIENLVVALGLKSSSFSSGLKKAQGDLSGFEKGVSAISSKVMGFAKSAAVFAAGYLGIQNVFQNVMASTERLGSLFDTASKLGIGTEALGALEFGAKLSGMEIENLTASLQKMILNINDASEGGSDAGLFKKLNLDLKKLHEMSPENQLRSIADALLKVKNHADKVSLAYGIFGKSGVPMLNLLEKGAKGLDEIMDRARKLGIVFSDLDVAKVEAMGDEWTVVKAAIDGMWDRLTIELAPALTLIARLIQDLVIASKEWGTSFIDSSDAVVSVLGYLTDVFMVQIGVMKTWANFWGTVVAGISALVPGQWTGGLAQMDEYLKKMEEAYELAKKGLGGGFSKDFEERLAKIREELTKERKKDVFSSSSDARVTPGAFLQGTSAAVEAEAKARNNKAEEHAKATADGVAMLNVKVSDTNAKLMAMNNLLGADAGIV
jgi:hypothetical protein